MNNHPVVSKANLRRQLLRIRSSRTKIVFTNGVFDIIHRGHIEYLRKAKAAGDFLIVGINTDKSVKKIKGPHRPIQNQNDRATIVASLKPVDLVVLFDETTPENLIRFIKPDVLVKGADYKISQIVGADFVKSYGGQVKRIRLTLGRSTSSILRRL
ncbi:MAG TPA: D-glycero-beta-D-manno-heptose 1-phosphate adenylyltransferase [candidate division Zixibacteria bacterium]|nr:D-glycero-beta-D-manno-heptose 1-phosphate adenylyltransferase [candidate division Zixibacteria bacterium]